MKIEAKTVVSIRYKMSNSSGEVLEDILSGLPISYLHGRGDILPALEAALYGLKEGDKKAISISNQMGYDEVDDEFYIEVIIDQIRLATTEELENGLKPKISSNSCCLNGYC